MKGVKTMADNKKKKDTKDEYITYNIYHEFVGDVTPIQAILPVIMEDLRRKRDKYLEEQKKKGNIDNK
jgi:hypothetical protein